MCSLTKFWNVYLFIWSCLQHVEVPRLGVESELQLQACATAMAMPNLSHICDLCYSLWQCLMLNPLSKARDLVGFLTHWATRAICFFKDNSMIFSTWGLQFLHLRLPNWTQVHSLAKQQSHVVVKESTVFVAGPPSKKNGQMILRRSELLDGFRVGFLEVT